MAVGLTPKREHRFDIDRRYRFDFAFEAQKLGVECEGTTFFGKNRNGTMRLGRHQTAKGFREDTIKYNLAVERGWRVLRYTKQEIKNGLALQQIERVLNHD